MSTPTWIVAGQKLDVQVMFPVPFPLPPFHSHSLPRLFRTILLPIPHRCRPQDLDPYSRDGWLYLHRRDLRSHALDSQCVLSLPHPPLPSPRLPAASDFCVEESKRGRPASAGFGRSDTALNGRGHTGGGLHQVVCVVCVCLFPSLCLYVPFSISLSFSVPLPLPLPLPLLCLTTHLYLQKEVRIYANDAQNGSSHTYAGPFLFNDTSFFLSLAYPPLRMSLLFESRYTHIGTSGLPTSYSDVGSEYGRGSLNSSRAVSEV